MAFSLGHHNVPGVHHRCHLLLGELVVVLQRYRVRCIAATAVIVATTAAAAALVVDVTGTVADTRSALPVCVDVGDQRVVGLCSDLG